MREYINHYAAFIQSNFPSLAEVPDIAKRIDYLISDRTVPVSRSAFARVQECVRNLYQYAHAPEAMESLCGTVSPEERSILERGPQDQRSVLMAYDFHYANDKLSLIEVNTNASSFLFVDSLYRAVNDDTFPAARDDLKNSFLEEMRLFGGGTPKKIAIIDDNPPKQKQYLEFLMYRDLFQSYGWPCDILDTKDFDNLLSEEEAEYDFIYNRDTDFYLKNHPNILRAYLERKICLSPNPREYLLLADKNRLLTMAEKKIDPALLEITKVTPENANELWSRRKKLFFKPSRMFGSKGGYRGSSVSRTVFDRLAKQEGYLAQEFAPPGTHEDFKFDLRFYAYQDRIQLACARLYKGQVTSFETLGGGLSRIRID